MGKSDVITERHDAQDKPDNKNILLIYLHAGVICGINIRELTNS